MKSFYVLLLWGLLALAAASHGQEGTVLAGMLSGSAVIDTAPVRDATGAPSADLLVRADGFTIRITGKTKIEWDLPLQSLAEVKAETGSATKANWIRRGFWLQLLCA